jgi:hypothetical protein
MSYWSVDGEGWSFFIALRHGSLRPQIRDHHAGNGTLADRAAGQISSRHGRGTTSKRKEAPKLNGTT